MVMPSRASIDIHGFQEHWIDLIPSAPTDSESTLKFSNVKEVLFLSIGDGFVGNETSNFQLRRGYLWGSRFFCQYFFIYTNHTTHYFRPNAAQ